MQLTAGGRAGADRAMRYAIVAALAAAFVANAAVPGLAANSPFGVAIPDSAPPPETGAFKSFFLWVSAQQSAFYKALVDAIKQMKASGDAGWLLIGLSFLYGLFHAAGPGHGKVVVSSYVLASDETARTGIAVSFAASMVQAATAVGLIGVAALVLNMTSIAITETTRVFEIGSYALVAALGVFLVWRKVLVPAYAAIARPAPHLATLSAAGHHHHHDHHHHGHDHDGHCCHVAGATTAEAIAASRTPLKDALAAIVAVGMRPCSGALIVLVFALSQGLFWAGVAAAFAMAFGTALVVSALVVLSVTAKSIALNVAGAGSGLAARLQAGVEGLAAVFILAVGLTLLYAALLQPAV